MNQQLIELAVEAGFTWRTGERYLYLDSSSEHKSIPDGLAKFAELILQANKQDTELYNDDDLAALKRFKETSEDDNSYDINKLMMKRLAEIGLVRRVTRDIYELTNFGLNAIKDKE